MWFATSQNTRLVVHTGTGIELDPRIRYSQMMGQYRKGPRKGRHSSRGRNKQEGRVQRMHNSCSFVSTQNDVKHVSLYKHLAVKKCKLSDVVNAFLL